MDLSAFAPKPFCGDFTENAEEWIRKYELFCEAAAFDDEKLCKILPLMLTTDAFTWYRTLTEDVRKDRNSLIQSFLKKFGKTYAHIQEQMNMFMDKQQDPDETVTEFISQVHRLAADLNVPPGMMTDKLGWHCSPEHIRSLTIGGKRGTPGDVEYGLRESEVCNRVCQQIDTVRKIPENVGNSINSATTKHGHDDAVENPKTVLPMNCDLGLNPAGAVTEKRAKQKLPRNYRTPCFRCGKCDHLPSQCRFIVSKCRKCKKIGHIAKMCKSKRSAKPRTKPFLNVSAFNSKMNKVKVRVGTTTTLALVDSGADISVMSSKLYKKAKMEKKFPIQNTSLFMKSVTGTHLNILGKATVPIKLGGLTLYQNVHISENVGQDLILGVDFLKHQRTQIDYVSDTLKIQGGMVEVPFCGINENFVCHVSLLHDVILPPRSETVFSVKTQANIENKGCLIEMHPSLYNTHSVLGASCLVRTNNNIAVAKMLNPTNFEITLKKNMIVGKLFDVDSVTSEMYENENCAEIANIETKHQNNRSQFIDKAKNLGVDLSESDLTIPEKEQILDLIGQNRDVFAKDMSELGCTKLFPHEIDTGNSRPVRQRAFRATPSAKAEISRQVEEQLKYGIIEPSTSEWASPVVLVKKKNGDMRFAVDYRKLNAVTCPKNFPLPRMEDIVDSLGGSKATIFSTLDLFSGYWQQQLDPATAHKSAFICHEGLFQYKRVPFGLQGSPSAFMRVMSEVLRDLNWKTVLIYMDDILVMSPTLSDHLRHLQQVFDKLRESNLKLKPMKCKFAAKEVKYLGHVLTKDGIAVDTSKTDAVRTFPRPKNTTDVRAFLGLANYYRKFVKDFADIAAPLHALLTKNTKFEWNDDCEKAFVELKNKLVSPPILAFPDFNKQFILYTDASGYAISYILGQKDAKGRETVIAYGERALKTSERRWSITDRECLALVEGVKYFRVYLANSKFQVYTDHSALTFVKKIKEVETNSRQARWAIYLQGYQFDISHKKGTKHSNADSLSRREYPTATSREEEIAKNSDKKATVEGQIEVDSVALLAEISELSTEELKENQRDDHDFADIIRYIEDRELPDEQKLAKRVINESQDYILDDGVLHHLYYPKGKGHRLDRLVKQLAVPHILRDDVLKSYHDSLLGGHQGKDRTYQTIRYKYFWPNMYSDITIYVRTCIECQLSKQDRSKHPAPLRPLPAQDVFTRVHLDLLGPLKTTPDGYKHVLVVSCAFSKWIEIYPLKTSTAIEVADTFYRNFICRYGAPDCILTDRGQQFMSKVLQEMCKMFQITKLKTSSYRPQTNATVERANSSILAKLRAYIDSDQSNWPELLAPIMFAMNTSVSTESTQYSPYYLLFGRETRTPLDTSLTRPEITGANAQEYVENVHKNIKTAREVARQNIQDAQTKYKTQHDKKAAEPNFKVQDKIWIDNRTKIVGLTPKLCNKWQGPYYITQDLGNNTYRVRRCSDHVEVKSPIHADRMKLYHSREVRPTNQTHHQDENNEMDDESDTDCEASEDNNRHSENPSPEPEDESDSEDSQPPCDVEKILRRTVIRGVPHYCIKWKGCSGRENTWEPESNIPKVLIDQFKQKKK